MHSPIVSPGSGSGPSSRLTAIAVGAILAAGCETETDPAGAVDTDALQAQSTQVDIVAMANALSTVAQRHIVRVQPPNHAPVYLMAVQNDGYSFHHAGLLWYRSDDGGATWSYYKDVIAQPDPAVYSTSRRPYTLHLTSDLIVVGSDIAAVYSYDTTRTGFTADAWDPYRVVYFQWWGFDGINDWNAGPRLTVASPASGQAYHRAELTRDSLGRIWVQAFLRRSDCTSPGSSSCTGDLLQVWTSSNEGSTFQGPQNLAVLPNQIGGGRLISVGSRLLMLWSDRSSKPAQLMTRIDSDPLTSWRAQANAFSDGAFIYHGAALSAVADGEGGLHLVYKDWARLYYRHFDGSSFGPARPLDSLVDWAMQPAITRSGSDLYICVNHLISTNANYEIRSYRLSAGFATWLAIDTQVQPKAYPNAPEQVGASDRAIPCAWGMGDFGTWNAGHTVQVAQQPVQAGSPPAANFTIAASPSSISTSSGESTASTISVTAQNGFGGAVSLAVSGIPTGATATLKPTSVTGSGSSTLTLSTGSATPGTYAVTVTGTSGSLVHSTNLSWTISSVAGPRPIFSDAFSRTTGLGSGWSIRHGSFTTDGTYAVSGIPPVYGNWASVVPAIGTNDYSVIADIIIPSGSLYSGIVARSSAAGQFEEDLYAAQISTNGTVNLYRRNFWKWTQLGSVAAGIIAGTQYRLELVAMGSSPVHLEVWLNGAKYISYDDSSSSRITRGIPGIQNYNRNVRYNSFGVYAR